MTGLDRATLRFERTIRSMQGALIGAVGSDAVGILINASMNSRLLTSFAVASAGAFLADRYIGKPEMEKNSRKWECGPQQPSL